jgi:hypothetical protein
LRLSLPACPSPISLLAESRVCPTLPITAVEFSLSGLPMLAFLRARSREYLLSPTQVLSVYSWGNASARSAQRASPCGCMRMSLRVPVRGCV